jgi:hypothetical protein
MLPTTRATMNAVFVNNYLVTESSFNLAVLELERTIPQRYIVTRYSYLYYIHDLILHKYKKEISIFVYGEGGGRSSSLNFSKLKFD